MVLVTGGNRSFLSDNIDVAKIDKSPFEMDVVASVSEKAMQLKTEVCEGDADTKGKYFATLKQNEMQLSGSAAQGGR
jgi:hypothetical protein